MIESKVEWQDGMHFIGELNGFQIPIDGGDSVGGRGLGPQPKGLSLTSLCGCTGMDVIYILRKMKVEPDDFSVSATADVSEDHPKVFTKIHLVYKFKGPDLPVKKINKAVSLSMEQYCGVTAMLQKAADIDYEIVIEE